MGELKNFFCGFPMPRYPKIACVKCKTKQRETEKTNYALSGARTDPRLSARTTLNACVFRRHPCLTFLAEDVALPQG